MNYVMLMPIYFLCMLGVYYLYREEELGKPDPLYWTIYFFILVWPITLTLLGTLLVFWATVRGLENAARRMGF